MGIVHVSCRYWTPAARLSLALLIAVIGGPGVAWGQDAAAKILTAEGRVSVYRDAQEWALSPGSSVRVGETIITGSEGFAQLQVADGSSFTVYPNSQVVFRKNPGSLRDLVDLVVGRLKAYIQKVDPNGYPYRVFTPTAVISVRGTSFDLIVDYDETTLIWVQEGLVGVNHRLLPGDREVALGPGQSLVVYPNSPLVKARIDTVKTVQVAGDIARAVAHIWARWGRSVPGAGGAGVPGAGGGTPLPGDTPAPAPPPAPPPGP